MSGAGALCRDCGALAPPRAGRCAGCGSPRLLAHPERDALAVAHVDCDAFFAAVAKRDDPSLRDRPLIIGGGRRGVVSTACYLARVRGVRSAMPMFQALRLCPEAEVRRPDGPAIRAAAEDVRRLMRGLTPLVMPVSVDEATLDLSGTERLHGLAPAAALARFARRVEAEVGISVSVGLSYNRFLAKMASEMDKPRGFAVIGRAEALALLAPRPVAAIGGVGRRAEARLARDGVRLIGDLQALGAAELARRYGAEGERLALLSRGVDERPVRVEREAKSLSAETTLDADVADPEALRRVLWSLAERVGARLRRAELAAGAVTLKLKTASFVSRTRARSGLAPTQTARSLFDAAKELLAREADGTRYRLVGLAAGDLGPADAADRGDLLDPGAPRRAAAERAADALRARFGEAALRRAVLVEPPADRAPSPGRRPGRAAPPRS